MFMVVVYVLGKGVLCLCRLFFFLLFFFFFQAEDGIRDVAVTGVQTCALPIYSAPHVSDRPGPRRVRTLSARPRREPGRGVRAADARRASLDGRAGRRDRKSVV